MVTPSYNQAEFLEETIRSVLLQNYPNLEYIVMDGGSTDSSVEIIQKYSPFLRHWESASDDGQPDAINRGFARSTGELQAWINSDDFYLPDALCRVACRAIRDPEEEFFIGGHSVVRRSGRIICKYYDFPQSFDSLLCGGQLFGQMASFWRREAFEEVGGLDLSLRFCFDYDFFLRLTRRRTPVGLGQVLAGYRLHEGTKSATIWERVGRDEKEMVQKRYGFHELELAARDASGRVAEAEFRRRNRYGLMRDVLRDPNYFGRIVGSSIRDAVISR